MAKNSIKKGKRGELTVCKILSKHFGKEFSRVPCSGATSTTHNLSVSAHKILAGDIVCPDNFVFCVENKYGYDISMENIFDKKHCQRKKLFEFIKQSVEESKNAEGLIPMVIYTKTRKKPLVILPFENHSKSLFLQSFLEKIDTFMFFKYKNEKWIIMSLSDLLDNAPEDFFYS